MFQIANHLFVYVLLPSPQVTEVIIGEKVQKYISTSRQI